MHHDELWQEFDWAGEPIMNGGRDASLGNPPFGSNAHVGAAGVWLFRHHHGEIEILFQHRSKSVDHNPDKWDVSAAGHMNYGEDPITCAVREAKEEIGVDLDKDRLRYIFTVASTDGKNMYNHCFLYDFTGRDDVFHFDDNEVSEVRWVPFSEFDSFIDQNAKDPIKNAKHTRALTKTFIKAYGNL